MEEKAKVIAAVWGSELIQFYAALDIFHQDDGCNGWIEERTLGGMNALEKWTIFYT